VRATQRLKHALIKLKNCPVRKSNPGKPVGRLSGRSDICQPRGSTGYEPAHRHIAV